MKSSLHYLYWRFGRVEVLPQELGSFFGFYFGFLSHFAFWDRRAG